MAKCDRCGEEEPMPYRCRLCGGTYCSDHRLPENHDCPGLEDWGDPSGVFDSGFDDSVQTEQSSGGVMESLPLDTGPGGPLGYLRGNVTYVFLGLMWFTFALQYALAPALGVEAPPGFVDPTWFELFTVSTAHPLYVWTWFTSIFSHGGLWHILLNSIVLYFFGPPVEQRIGSSRFAALFLATGAVAGLAQVGSTLLLNPGVFVPVLGASGAIAAVMGVLTVLNPNLRIYLYFVIPMPLWMATALFAGFAVLSSTVGGIGAGGVAQVAHLAGLVLGLGYGWRVKQQGTRGPEQLQFGGGGGGPGRRRGPF